MNSKINNRKSNFFKKGSCVIASMHSFLESFTSVSDQKIQAIDNRFIEVDLLINQNELKSQQIFYSTTLNLPLIKESPTSFSIQAGKTQINFIADNIIQEPYYHLAFNIPENKIKQAKKWSQGRFALLTTEDGEDIIHFKKWNAHSIYFMDPGGNVLEFIAHHKLSNKTKGDFTSNDILYLIEVGLVSQNVKSLASEIKNKTGLKDYIKADEIQNSSKFRAVGDTAGMLILSKTERAWLMTDMPSKEIPLNLKMKNEVKQNAIVSLGNNKYKIELIN